MAKQVNKEEEKVEDTASEEVVPTTTPVETHISVEDKKEIAEVAAVAVAQAMAHVLPTGVQSMPAQEAQTRNLEVTTAKVNTKRQAVAKEYAKEKKCVVSISPMYRPQLGRVANISLNGVSVYVPVDGGYYEINESHAALLLNTIRGYDKIALKAEKMHDVTKNLDSSPGTLHFG